MPPKRFSDFADERPLDGDKARMDEVLGKEITVVGYRIKASKFSEGKSGKCLTLQFELDDQRWVLFTGSEVLMEQTKKYSEQMPFLTTIKKIDRYFTFT